MHILHLCAESWIRLNGKKIYLDEYRDSVLRKIRSGNKFITLSKSTLTGNTDISVKASDITELGDCDW